MLIFALLTAVGHAEDAPKGKRQEPKRGDVPYGDVLTLTHTGRGLGLTDVVLEVNAAPRTNRERAARNAWIRSRKSAK